MENDMKINKINIYYISGQPRRCKICGEMFAMKGGSKYCSDKCKRNGCDSTHHEVILKKCVVCGKEFKINKTKRSSGEKFKYCSKDCKVKYERRAKYNRSCIICGNEFISKSINKKACSTECRLHIFSVPRKTIEEKLQAKEKRKKRNNKLEMERRKSNPLFSLKCRMRSLMYSSLRRNKNGKKWEDLVGYSTEELRFHLENKFAEGMTWEKFMGGEIHIDHIIPVTAFNFQTPGDIDFLKCWSLGNLQPLWWKDNLIKHDKLDKPFQPSLAIGA